MEDRCVCCGEIIPEGNMTCVNCQLKILYERHSLTEEKPIIIKRNGIKIIIKNKGDKE